MRTKFGILWTIFVFGALQLSHYSCADDLENQNKTTATTVIPSASPTTKAKEDTITVTEGNINQSTSASRTSSVTEVVQTDSATTTVNPAAPTTVPPKPTDEEPQTTSVVTTALPASTGPPTSLTTSISPSVTSSVTTLETKTTQNTPSLTESQGTTQNTPSLTSSQATTQTDSVTETTNSPKQTSVASPTTEKIKDALTPTTEISPASPTAGNTSPTQPQNITTSSTQQNIATSSTQPQNITTAPTQPPTTGTSSTQTGNVVLQPARADDSQDSSAILTTTLAGVTKSPAKTEPFSRQIEWTEAKNQEDKNDVLLKVCWELLKNMNSETSCIIQGNETNKNYTFTSVHVAADLSRVKQIYSNIKKSNDNPEQLRMPEVLPVVLASCGALVLILVAFVLCYMCHRRLYRKNQGDAILSHWPTASATSLQQQLTEEMQTMENGYHDNPTLEVMEFQPEMQEKKPPLNGEFNDSWIVPIDNLPKDDFSEEEDTHL